VNQELFALFTQYGGLIVNALNNSTPGFEVADYVSGLLGTAAHVGIVRHGEAAILQTMRAFPEIAMFGEPRLQQFVHEFVHFEEYSEDEDLPDGEPARAVRSGAKGDSASA
jgi:hypothetical protein